MHNIPSTFKILKKVKTDLDSFDAPCSDCIPVVVSKSYEEERSCIVTDPYQGVSEEILFCRLLGSLICGSIV